MLAAFILDCAEHTILSRLMAEGRMPVLASLAERGATIPLRSEAHLLDGAVMQTLLTGVGPGHHGIYKYVQLVPGTRRYAATRAAGSPVPHVWQVLSERGLRCCVFDVPKAFPAPGFNGCLVNCWGAYVPAARAASIPPPLRRAVLRCFGRHPQPVQLPVPLTPQRYQAVLGRLKSAVFVRAEICRWLLRDEPCDFFITAFCEGHVASHQFWHLRRPDHPLYEKQAADACGNALEQLYCAIDAAIGRVLDALPSNATVLAFTQQGVQDNFSGSHLLPAWLMRRSGVPAGRATQEQVFRLASSLSSSLRARLNAILPPSLVHAWLARKYRPADPVFLLPGSEFMAFLRVNLQGREPAGTVAPDDYETVISQVREDILALRNPETGSRAAAEVVFPHLAYSGQCVDLLPDIVVRWANDAPVRRIECPRYGLIGDGLRFVDKTHSSHTGEGMAILAGPDIASRTVGGSCDLRDLTATILALLGEEPPAHLEGTQMELAEPVSAIGPTTRSTM